MGSRLDRAVGTDLEQGTGCTVRRVEAGDHPMKVHAGRSSDCGLDCTAGRRLLDRLQEDLRKTAEEGSLVERRTLLVVEVDSLAERRSHLVVGRKLGLVDMVAGHNLADPGKHHPDVVDCSRVDLGPRPGSNSRWMTWWTKSRRCCIRR